MKFFPISDWYYDFKLRKRIREIENLLTVFFNYPVKLKKRSKKNKILNREIYGVDVFNKEKFIKVYRKHLDSVKEYFKNRKDDLLIMNICGGEGWEKLCSFLNKPVSDEPFPVSNIARKSFIAKMYYKIKRY